MTYLPQILVIAIFGIHLGINAARHGQYPKEEKINVNWAIARVVLLSALLFWGGFFKFN